MNPAPYNRQPVHGQAGDSFGQVDTGDRLHSMPTPPAYGVPTRPEGHARTGDTTPARAWTGAPPLPYRDDTNPPPHWFWGDIYKRMKRRPRCGEIGGNDGR